MDGLTAMARLRQTSNVPVILLTAKSEDTDKILGLNVGADDYITKPFNPVEVLARVRSQLRRYLQLGGRETAPSLLTIGPVSLDDEAKRVTLDGAEVPLTPKEYDILRFLMDISADLQEFANTPVAVVCAGAKSILDLGLTLEYLETYGVPVLGLRTDEFPAFFCRTSGHKLDFNCPDEQTVARIMMYFSFKIY